jgi:hypothetical protein
MADASAEPFRMADQDAVDAWRSGTPASPDIASLVGGGNKDLLSSFVSLDKSKAAEDKAITGAADKRMTADQARLDAAYKAEGVSAAEMPHPWNAEAEHKKFESNPIEAFGSVGGIFAMIASAFTKAPMENAINGMAGAINGQKEANEAEYTRAHEAWKDNTKLALDRFKTQHDLYSDAMSLMDHDAAASNAKLHNAAVRFGDSQMLMLAEHGMVKEMFELQESRARAASQMQDLADKTTVHDFQKAAAQAVQRGFQSTGDPVKDKMILATQIQRIYKGDHYGTAEQEAVGQYVMSHQANDPKFAEGLADLHQQFSPKAQNIAGYQDAKAQMEQERGSPLTPDEDAGLLQKFGLTGRPGGAGGTGSQSSQARKTRAIEEIQKKHADEGKPVSMAEAEREFNKTVQIPSAHDVHQDDTQYAKAERMETAMNEMDQLLLKHKFITGIGGSITRPVEALGNVLGSNETDRKQFQRIATELKEWGQSVVNDRSGRPLSSEAKDAAVIFAGLNPGDTGPNTVRAITELRPVIKRIKEDIKARGQGRGPVSGGGETPAVKADDSKNKDAPWLNDPVKP